MCNCGGGPKVAENDRRARGIACDSCKHYRATCSLTQLTYAAIRSAPKSVCPIGRHPDEQGRVRWGLVTTIGVPKWVRWRYRKRIKGPLDGCGCLAFLADTWGWIMFVASYCGWHRNPTTRRMSRMKRKTLDRIAYVGLAVVVILIVLCMFLAWGCMPQQARVTQVAGKAEVSREHTTVTISDIQPPVQDTREVIHIRIADCPKEPAYANPAPVAGSGPVRTGNGPAPR